MLNRFSSVLLLLILSSVLILNPIFAETNSQTNSTQDPNLSISKRLLTIEQRLRLVSENQKLITQKNSEIQEQLKSLRIWIFRRGGGASS